jgi:hypothetical protein
VRAVACWNDALGLFSGLGAPESQDVRLLLAQQTPSSAAG